MNSEPELKEPKPKTRPTVLWYVGMPVMLFGIVSASMFAVRQFKERSVGHTYYEFIVAGVLFAVVGFVLLSVGLRRIPPR